MQGAVKLVCLMEGGEFDAMRKFGRLCCTMRGGLRGHKNGGRGSLTSVLSSRDNEDGNSMLDVLASLPGIVRRVLGDKRSIAVHKLNSFRTTIADSNFRRPRSMLPRRIHLSEICFITSHEFAGHINGVGFFHCPLSGCFPGDTLQTRALMGRTRRRFRRSFKRKKRWLGKVADVRICRGVGQGFLSNKR